jgi:hypothetical protein
MTLSKRRKRTAKKLVLPLLAVVWMVMIMYMGRPNSPTPSPGYRAPAGAAARVPHDLRTR